MVKTILKALIVFAILLAASLLAYYFIKNPAHTDKKEIIETHKTIVKTKAVMLGTYPIKIEVMGQVIPAHETALQSQISGEIIKTSDEFLPGGFLQKGEEILQIDPSNYELDMKVKKAAWRQAKAALRLELGQQEIAQKELQIIEQSTGRKITNSSLALRKPQLEQAKANLESAKASLELSELNLSRTKIKSPFNAIVTKRNANIGDIVSTQEILANLVNIDEYWIDVEIPIHDIRWLKTGDKAIINLDDNRDARVGKLLKITGSIDQNTRLANLIISVPDPLLMKDNTQGSPMILQDYVQVTLIGKTLENIAIIPLSYIRDNNTIWIERDGKLVIEKITIVHEDRKFAYVTKGIRNADNIVTSNIVTPINGMDIKVQNNE